MHQTAMQHGQLFFDGYVRRPGKIIDIGAQDVNGSLRSIAPANCDYLGVDFEAARGVDIVIDDPYSLPFPDASFDYAVSSSCFEHSEFFWLTFVEILRVLKPGGLFYLNAPANGLFHRYPVDCWRFYPDSGLALRNWARREGVHCEMLESFTGAMREGIFNDFVAVFVKDASHAPDYPHRMMPADATNGLVLGSDELVNYFEWPEDQRGIRAFMRRFGL